MSLIYLNLPQEIVLFADGICLSSHDQLQAQVVELEASQADTEQVQVRVVLILLNAIVFPHLHGKLSLCL